MRSGKDFLSTVADGNQTAFTRTFCTEGIVVYLLFKLARQMVGKGDTCEIVFAVGIRKTGIFAGNMDTDVEGDVKRISLYMIDSQCIFAKSIYSFRTLISRINIFLSIFCNNCLKSSAGFHVTSFFLLL